MKTRGGGTAPPGPKRAGSTAFFPQHDRSYGLKRNAFQTGIAQEESHAKKAILAFQDKEFNCRTLTGVVIPGYVPARSPRECFRESVGKDLPDRYPGTVVQHPARADEIINNIVNK